MRTKSKGKGRSAKVRMAGVLLLASLAVARQGTITLEPANDVRQFDQWVCVLMDSAVCDTCMTADSRAVLHRVWVDSGRVMYQRGVQQGATVTSPSSGLGHDPECRTFRSCPVALSTSRNCGSPLVFERQDPGQEPFLVAMWREESSSRVDVMCRYQFSDAWPQRWGPMWNVTFRRE